MGTLKKDTHFVTSAIPDSALRTQKDLAKEQLRSGSAASKATNGNPGLLNPRLMNRGSLFVFFWRGTIPRPIQRAGLLIRGSH